MDNNDNGNPVLIYTEPSQHGDGTVIILQIGDKAVELTTDMAMDIAEALAECAGYIEGQGSSEPETPSQIH